MKKKFAPMYLGAKLLVPVTTIFSQNFCFLTLSLRIATGREAAHVLLRGASGHGGDNALRGDHLYANFAGMQGGALTNIGLGVEQSLPSY
jgi:hypothetical protein